MLRLTPDPPGRGTVGGAWPVARKAEGQLGGPAGAEVGSSGMGRRMGVRR